MPAALIAFVVFVVVALAAFMLGSIFDQRNAQARLIKERLANERKAPELAAEEELALLRDEQLSQIPALDSLLRRSARVSDIQKMLAQAGMSLRAGNFLALSALTGVLAAFLAYAFSKRVEIAWIAMLVGFVLPYSYASYRRNKRFEKFEELFPEAIDTLARAVRAGHAFTTALEMITDEVAEPVAGEFRQLFEEQKFGMPVRDALMNLTERMPLVDVKFFVTAVMLQRETGGNLAEILDNLSYVIRERFKIQRQVRVYTAQGRLTMALLMGMPPIIVTVMMVLNPSFIRPLFADPDRTHAAGGWHHAADGGIFCHSQDYPDSGLGARDNYVGSLDRHRRVPHRRDGGASPLERRPWRPVLCSALACAPSAANSSKWRTSPESASAWSRRSTRSARPYRFHRPTCRAPAPGSFRPDSAMPSTSTITSERAF